VPPLSGAAFCSPPPPHATSAVKPNNKIKAIKSAGILFIGFSFSVD